MSSLAQKGGFWVSVCLLVGPEDWEDDGNVHAPGVQDWDQR